MSKAWGGGRGLRAKNVVLVIFQFKFDWRWFARGGRGGQTLKPGGKKK